ncbi:MAG: hypothetical protein AAGB31_12030 [Bdellovibrio sp.]
MKLLLFIFMPIFTSLTALGNSHSCTDLDMQQFAGSFKKFEYSCTEETLAGSKCHSLADPYNSVNNISIQTALDTTEGLHLVLSKSTLYIPEIAVFAHSLGEQSRDNDTICSEFEANGIAYAQIKSTLRKGSEKRSFTVVTITKGPSNMELEVLFSSDKMKRRYKFLAPLE